MYISVVCLSAEETFDCIQNKISRRKVSSPFKLVVKFYPVLKPVQFKLHLFCIEFMITFFHKSGVKLL